METPVGYPKAFSYFNQTRLPVSRQQIKILSSTPQSATAGQTVSFTLPGATLIDMRSISVNGTITTAADAGVAVPPRFIECLLDSVQVEIGGQVVTANSPLYNHLYAMMAQFQREDRTNIDSVLGFAQRQTTGPAANIADVPFSMTHWLGFLGSSSTPILHTGVLPQVRINLRLAPNSVLTTSGATNPTYLLSGLNLCATTYSFLDGGAFDTALQNRIASNPPSITWSDNLCIMGGVQSQLTGAHRFNVACQSLDALHSWFLPGNYNVAGGSNISILSGTSRYFIRGAQNQNLTHANYSLNSTNFPSWGEATVAEVFRETLVAQGEHLTNVAECYPSLSNLSNFESEMFVHSQRFNHVSPSTENQYMSGVNTISSTANIVWNYRGGAAEAAGVIPVTFAEHTRKLVIGAGKQISYFQ